MSTVSKNLVRNSTLKVRTIAGYIGAKIKSVHLSSKLDAETVSSIKKALLKHEVVFFKGQGHIDDAEQEAFAKLFGESEAHPTVPIKEGSNFRFIAPSKSVFKSSWINWGIDYSALYMKEELA